MSGLRRPLRESLRGPFPDREAGDEDLDEIHRRARSLTRRSQLTRAGALASVAAVAVLAVVLVRREVGLDRTALALEGGAAVPAHLASERAWAFSEGSRIVVFEGGELARLRASDREASFLLERGTASFEVAPGTGRTWSIECGLLTVSVLGTTFTIERRLASERRSKRSA